MKEHHNEMDPSPNQPKKDTPCPKKRWIDTAEGQEYQQALDRAAAAGVLEDIAAVDHPSGWALNMLGITLDEFKYIQQHAREKLKSNKSKNE